MKTLLTFILIIFSSCFYGQKSKSHLLKDYEYYVEENVEMGKWSTKYYLSNGLVTSKEDFWKNELQSSTEFEYDQYGNLQKETEIYNINIGQVNNVSCIKLKYNDTLLVYKEFDFGLTEKYSAFHHSGKPKLIERIDKYNMRPYKVTLEYDERGNIIKSIELTSTVDWDNNPVNEKETTYYKYDNFNNVIEIHREFEPRQEFPIIITGGPAQYEYENFRYKYNKNGLWTKKYKTVDGKEYLIVKRKYK